jgi:hypothetical protein
MHRISHKGLEIMSQTVLARSKLALVVPVLPLVILCVLYGSENDIFQGTGYVDSVIKRLEAPAFGKLVGIVIVYAGGLLDSVLGKLVVAVEKSSCAAWLVEVRIPGAVMIHDARDLVRDLLRKRFWRERCCQCQVCKRSCPCSASISGGNGCCSLHCGLNGCRKLREDLEKVLHFRKK